MHKTDKTLSRRTLLRGMVAGTAISLSGSLTAKVPNTSALPATTANAVDVAKDEKYWAEIARFYDATQGIVNLEHGYWGKMAHPVQEYYLAATKMVNRQNSYYARKDYDDQHQLSVQRVARALGAHEDEIVLTRNATESIHNLIRQYRGLTAGDAVLYADVDYPSFKTAMVWLKQAYSVDVVELKLPVRANQQELLSKYIAVFDANPQLKLMLLTHVSNQHGLVLPVKAITDAARERGIDVICDSAQSWGLIDYKVNDIGVDWIGFNLHKWIGSPLGVGALYMRRGSLNKIAPYPGEKDPQNNDASTRVHSATSNFAAMLSIPSALDFHESIGATSKEARLRYLRSLWSAEAENMPHIEMLGGTDEASRTGMGSFRLIGKNTVDDAKALQQKLENDFGIFTVIRKGLASGACVRITPQVFNTPAQIELLVNSIKQLNS